MEVPSVSCVSHTSAGCTRGSAVTASQTHLLTQEGGGQCCNSICRIRKSLKLGLGDMEKNVITICFSILIDLDSYHDL